LNLRPDGFYGIEIGVSDIGARHVEVIFFSGNEGQLTVSTKCFSSENVKRESGLEPVFLTSCDDALSRLFKT
jgi:hypothetical protein